MPAITTLCTYCEEDGATVVHPDGVFHRQCLAELAMFDSDTLKGKRDPDFESPNICRSDLCRANLDANEPHTTDCEAHPPERVPETLDELLASGDPDEAYEAWWL